MDGGMDGWISGWGEVESTFTVLIKEWEESRSSKQGGSSLCSLPLFSLFPPTASLPNCKQLHPCLGRMLQDPPAILWWLLCSTIKTKRGHKSQIPSDKILVNNIFLHPKWLSTAGRCHCCGNAPPCNNSLLQKTYNVPNLGQGQPKSYKGRYTHFKWATVKIIACRYIWTV